MSRKSRAAWIATFGLFFCVAAVFAEREFRVYASLEPQAEVPLPEGWDRPAGFVVARMMYPGNFGFRRRGFGDWRLGGTAWAVDYPRGDRYYAMILRRLTTIDVRPAEQPVNLDDGEDVYDWPFMIVGLPGFWELSDEQVAKLRDYLLRGGFLIADSFFGTDEWEGFVEGMRRVFPDREIIDLPDDHPLLHTVYDLNTRGQVPNWNSLFRGGGGGYRNDGDVPHWRAIVDDEGRVMVAIAFNNDLGDSYQWADNPEYPAEGASLGLRMGVNMAVYALSH